MTSARAQLDAWREHGADRVDPVRFSVLDALERRAADHGGEARRLLDARLAVLTSEYAAAVDRANAADANDPSDPAVAPGATDTLSTLVADLAARPKSGDAASALAPQMVEDFRKIWSQVRARQQFREAIVQVPQNAGPLNSNSLVHRALSLMRELSPGYLQHFLSYADALSWLEQLNAVDAPAVKEAPRAAGAKKTTRTRSR